jgi:ABC-type polysaccharide/polyol phosphate transport system ATPase subunit
MESNVFPFSPFSAPHRVLELIVACVVFENVRVEFPIYGSSQRSLRRVLFERATGGLVQRRGRKQDQVVIQALENLSFTLEDGDRIALIGHNGSGKSTLLRVMAGIYEPVAGRVLINGRVTPLFETMPGFDPEDTGYENIITAGLLVGMSRQEIENKIPEIEEFSELGEYLSLPVRTYSAGMTTRLGFAFATAINPHILLLDEGIGAGDLRFAERAAARMHDFIGRSRVLVLASHSNELIKSICTKGALLHQGRLLAIGPLEEVLEEYSRLVHSS